MINKLQKFFKNKDILITGHTGFKGAWLSKILTNWRANVYGYSLEPPTNPNIYNLINLKNKINFFKGDVRNFNYLKKIFEEVNPEIVIHLAAQPLVKEGYINPQYTYETNIMGTVNICECIRNNKNVKSFLNITTDKVYENNEWIWGYRENEKLNGYDPYSNSKSCSDLITQSYYKSFFKKLGISTSIARAGNVIGGGDFAKDRIIPDCVKGALNHENIIIRNPYSIRPYQHVLEPLSAYLTIIKGQYNNISLSDCYNIGPNSSDCITTSELVNLFCKEWGNGLKWINESSDNLHEANYLKLDSSKVNNIFNWKPKWNIEEAVKKTIEWTKIYCEDGSVKNLNKCMDKQIINYFKNKK
jgi:CDP-glucose 4,6-dehydratase